MKIGVLDLQGSVTEHINMLKKIETVIPVRVKYKDQIERIDGLIIPGGESTTISKLLKSFDLMDILKKRIKRGMPIWGTCAGMILLAKKIDGSDNAHLKVMDIDVKRNAYGSQLDSFLIEDKIPDISKKSIPLVFIRAPYITNVSNDVKILKKVNEKIVAAKQKNILVTSFHPELTGNDCVHKYFIRNFFNNNFLL
ncbi:pyridoxal 5'-phosphate synthase glutaminase subunit PdxT [Haloimpatiens sp. FM7330]|uniref:pyridoxal 5'-phosphate synthase glutaminase subunit PdxT n=1 Tax=Haloimpatiens sp. FM7330 TaxID=3298610 RepID=UPI00363AFC23